MTSPLRVRYNVHMDIKTTLPISEARKKIFKISDDVQKTGRHYTLTENGHPKAVILSAEEYESMMETMEVERLFPDLDKDIAEVKRAMKTGEWKKWPTLADLEHDWGMAGKVADKSKITYGVSRHSKTGSKKKSR